MSRLKLFQTYQPDPEGPAYGRVVQPQDLMDIQEYLERRIDLVLRDLVIRTAAVAQVEGFAHALPGGMSFRVAAGQATDLLGRSFESYPLDENNDLQIGAAPPSNSRIDLVYASLVAEQDAEPILLLHRRLRVQAEYEQNVPEYTPDEINVNTERRNVALLNVRAGAVAANPAAPAVGANEVPLYHVRVDAGDVAIAPGKVTDARNRMRSLYQLMQNVITLEGNPAITNLAEQVDDRVAALLQDTASVVKAYDDGLNTLTLSVPAEYVQDVVGLMATAGPGISVAYNDAAASLTFSIDVEWLQDAIAGLLTVAANNGLALVYNDAAGTFVLSGVAATGAAMGMMSAADFSKLAASTSAATASALAQRDANGDASFRRLTSTMANGTSPLVVTSQTEVANLNANFVQGQNLAGLDARFVNATGDDSMAGKLTGYNGQALAGFGLPAIVARYSNANVIGSLGSTPLVAGAGDYLILVMTYTTAANGSIAVSLHFTDPSSNAYNPQVTSHDLVGGAMGSAAMVISTNAAGVNFSTAWVGPGSYGIRVIALRFN